MFTVIARQGLIYRDKMKKAISISEYAVIIFIAAAVFVTMGIYVKRAIQGRWRDAADSFGAGMQYSPSSHRVTVSPRAD